MKGESPTEDPPTEKKESRGPIGYLWRLLLTCVLVGLLVARVDLESLLAVFSQTKMGLALLSFWVLIVLSPLLSSIQLRMLLQSQGPRLSLRKVWSYDLVARFYGVFVPGLGAGATRLYFFRKLLGDGAVPLAALIFNRLMKTSTLLSVGLVCWMLGKTGHLVSPAYVVCGLFLIGGLYLSALQPSILNLAEKVSLGVLPAALKGRVNRVFQAIQSVRGAGLKFHISLLSLAFLRQATSILGLWLMARALGISLGYLVFGWIRAVEVVVTTLPVTLAGIGLREITFVTLLGELGVVPAPAFALSVLLTLSALSIALSGGLMEIAMGVKSAEPR